MRQAAKIQTLGVSTGIGFHQAVRENEEGKDRPSYRNARSVGGKALLLLPYMASSILESTTDGVIASSAAARASRAASCAASSLFGRRGIHVVCVSGAPSSSANETHRVGVGDERGVAVAPNVSFL